MDLKDLQRRLNEDEEFRNRFLADPVGTLEAEGLVLPDEAKDSLRQMTDALRKEAASVPGSTLTPQEEGVGISINIAKDF